MIFKLYQRNKEIIKDNVKTFIFTGGASLNPISANKIKKINKIQLNQFNLIIQKLIYHQVQ